MKVTLNEVERIVSLSMLELDDGQKEAMQKDLSAVINHVQKLNELDTDGVEPTTYISKQQNITREDIPHQQMAREELLKNAPEQQDGCFIVPKVVD